MTGNLTVTGQPSAPEQAPRARSAAHALIERPERPAARPRLAQEITVVDRLRPDDPDWLEVVRLKALVTDPSLRVTMHHDEASGRVVMQVVSRATGEVVDQIPAEELLRLYSALREPLLDERA